MFKVILSVVLFAVFFGVSTVVLPRGIRNNNPLNLIKNNTAWKGLAKDQGDSRFFIFSTEHFGLRAAARTLMNYQNRHNIHTIQGVIKRWAPPFENDTIKYIKVVSDGAAISPDAVLNLQDPETLLKIMRPMIEVENGFNPFPDHVILLAIKDAKI